MAIAMAQAGGIGVIHRNLEPDEQAAQVRQVKKFESGMVVNPVTIAPDATLADALGADEGQRHLRHSGGRGAAATAQPGKLVGILTNRDVRFATDPRQPVAELMTKERLVTVREGVGQDEAKRLLHQHRIEKLLVVDDDYRCVGLITVKDIEKAVSQSRTPARTSRAACASPPRPRVGDDGFERTERLIDAGVDLIVVDTAHGHSQRVLEAVDAHQEAVERGAGDRRQCRDRRRRQGADRCRRRRGQGRHRARARSAPPASSPASACRSSPRSWMRSRRRAKPACR